MLRSIPSQPSRQIFAAVAAFSILVFSAPFMGHAYATGQTHRKVTYVLLLHPGCDYQFRDKFDHDMHLNNTDSERFFGYYEVACMGGISNLTDINSRILPILRIANPAASFVFVYPDSMKDQFDNYIGAKYGEQYRYLALGNTDVATGSSFANETPVVIKHEMGHLAICGTWHDAQGKDTGRITRYLGADSLPWCN